MWAEEAICTPSLTDGALTLKVPSGRGSFPLALPSGHSCVSFGSHLWHLSPAFQSSVSRRHFPATSPHCSSTIGLVLGKWIDDFQKLNVWEHAITQICIYFFLILILLFSSLKLTSNITWDCDWVKVTESPSLSICHSTELLPPSAPSFSQMRLRFAGKLGGPIDPNSSTMGHWLDSFYFLPWLFPFPLGNHSISRHSSFIWPLAACYMYYTHTCIYTCMHTYKHTLKI